MGAAYTIFGRTVQPHILALATIVGTVGGATYKMMGSSGSETSTKAVGETPSKAQDSGDLDVEKLLDNYLSQSEKQ
ncbi:LADA_0G07294g1_1 [Lachancea dasiensis]|uniref:LADA_0G07294g1_1 n=1 Tax=Lachancea dasiensis TaxID=1072105 RepID=A0A1G4JTK7_9SACH|nr:LADA_0G07294g1_1 [Lachancea dasiensis]